MRLHPLAGLFRPGEGPALRPDADGCAHEEHGRWTTRPCSGADPTHIVLGNNLNAEPLLCAPHADVWRGTPAVLEGALTIAPLDAFTPEEA